MTASEKTAISLPRQTTARSRRAVKQGQAASTSAYVAVTLDEKAKLDDLAELLDEMLTASGGPLTVAEARAADRAIGAAGKKAKGR
jgi:hypothetical protein